MSPHVYIFEKEPEYAELLKGICSTTDFSSTVFNSTSECFYQIPRHGILVLDIKMSFCDGMEIINALARIDNTIKLILMSSSGEGVLKAAKEQAQSNGLEVTTCLKKPILVSVFRHALAQAAQELSYCECTKELESQVFKGVTI